MMNICGSGNRKPNGEIWILEIEKEFDEDLGIEFTNPLIDRAKSCMKQMYILFY